jgi:hypothetical protein
MVKRLFISKTFIFFLAKFIFAWQNQASKTNVYFMIPMHVFHIELYVHWSSFGAIIKYCNMFQTYIFWKTFNKILMQWLHANIIQMGGYNAIRQKLYVLMQISHLSKLFKMSKNLKNMDSVPLFVLKKNLLRYICYSLTSRDPFLKLFSLATMSFFTCSFFVVVATLVACWWV